MNTLQQYNSSPVYCSSIVLWAVVVKGSAEGARGWRRESRRVDDSFNNSVTVSRCHQKPAAAVWSCGCAGSRCVSSDRRLVCVPVQTASTGPAEPAGAETAVQEPASTAQGRVAQHSHHCCILNHKLLPVLLLWTGYGCWTSCLDSSVCGFFLTCFHGKLCFWPARCEDASAWEQSWPTTPRMQTTVRRLSTRVTWLQVADYHSALWVCGSLSIYLCFYVTLIYLKMHTNALDLISRCI